MPKVSVILAVYNVEPYLERSLDCLINQTLKDIEIICIDDCSTDKSLEILRDYAKKDDRIIVIESDKNQGAAVARNKGLKIAKGEYLGFIDPDDAIDLNYYEELYKTAKEKNVDVVKCERKIIYPDGRTVLGHLNNEIRQTNPYMFNYEWTTAIYSSDFIKQHNINFPEDCKKSEDDVFITRVMFRHASLALIDGVYYYYYRREGSLNSSSISIEGIKASLKAIGIMLEEINASKLYNNNIELYVDLYEKQLETVFYTLFQNNTLEAKQLCAEALIKYFYRCFDIEKLKSKFPYPWMLKYFEKKELKGLTKALKQQKEPNNIQKPLKWYQKIFSIKNSNNSKIIYVLGIKIIIGVK